MSPHKKATFKSKLDDINQTNKYNTILLNQFTSIDALKNMKKQESQEKACNTVTKKREKINE